MSHAELVELAFMGAIDKEPYESYFEAKRKAEELGGTVVFDENRSTPFKRLYPTRIYQFADGTFCEVSYRYARIMSKREVNELVTLDRFR